MKKRYLLVLLLFMVLCLSGCGEKQEIIISNGEKVNTASMIHEHCTRAGVISDGDVSLNYDIYYTGEVLNLLQSEEKVISSNDETLTIYEDAYKAIHAHYDGLQYYDTEVIRGDTTVTSKITIQYDKLDINQLLAIEGAEDNIIEDGVAKVGKWKEFAKKFGTTCEKVDDSV